MHNLNEILDLDENTLSLLQSFKNTIADLNKVINLISRKDIDHLEERHMLPSLLLAKFCQFANGSTILDVGTGGGFPGIPLAIIFPNCHFTLVDSIGKKINAVQSIATQLGLKNVHCKQLRVEDYHEKFDFVIGRAVTALPQFLLWTAKNIKPGQKSSLPNGLLYLKGGDFQEELKQLKTKPDQIFDINEFCPDKCIVYFKHPIKL